MKRGSTIETIAALTIIALFSTALTAPGMTLDKRATQISGVGAFAAPGECDDPEGEGSDYALSLTGDLSGCHYVFVEVSRCSPGRAYFEAGTETFVGAYNGGSGTFDTNYVFTAAYRDCSSFGGQIAGRCQHPIAAGSGTDVFEGVIGRIDMRDDVATGSFSYRGHLSFDDANSAISVRSYKNALDLIGGSTSLGGC
jgi:hypothetical protein